jgi:predicted NBD/HSP70 family sugar kinase
VPLRLAFERSDASVSQYSFEVLPENHPHAATNFFFVERLCKFLLWSRGAATIFFDGPAALCAQLQEHYQRSATGRFDAAIMGNRIYDRPFSVVRVSPAELPSANEFAAPLGRHLEGCRIGFDLGASDRKAAAVIDGKPVFTEEVPWDPRPQADPQWHFDQIMDSLKRAAAHLPRVDAIGGSSAGVYVGNRVKVASLFRGVPEPLFEKRVKDLFLDLKRAWNNIPFEVVNDGEVTALAGAMSLQGNAVLGIALGSSQAAGYVTPAGNITSWLNELAFAPIDYRPAAPADEWSGDLGCGVQYFSQQAVGRLLPASGLEIDPALPLPEKLVEVQHAMSHGDTRAAKIYQCIGVYLGYTVAHYKQFYDFQHLLVLGRVTTGQGGEIIVNEANRILLAEFPDLQVRLHLPDEKDKRHGQAVAAASLPVITQAPA